MLLPSGSRVYVDSNVWAYYFVGSDHRHVPACKRFLREVAEGRFKAVASTFVLQELLAIAVRARSQTHGAALTPEETELLAEELIEKVRKFGTEIHDSDLLASSGGLPVTAFARSHMVVKGSDAVYDSSSTGKVRWKSPGAADGLHCAFAERIEDVDAIATCDFGMSQMHGSVDVLYLPGEYK